MPRIDLSGNLRHNRIFSKLKTIIFDLAGSDLSELDHVSTFLELGFDSLFLIQMSTAMKGALGVDIAFRQLIEETDTFEDLVHYLDEHLSESHDLFSQGEMADENILEDAIELDPVQEIINEGSSKKISTAMTVPSFKEGNSGMATLISQQLELMSHQLEVLRQQGHAFPQAVQKSSLPLKGNSQRTLSDSSLLATVEQKKSNPRKSKPFGAIARITREKTEDLSSIQQQWLDDFVRRYNKRTIGSKEYGEMHRPHMADPRVVTGFKSKIKNLIYPIVVDRTEGCHIWDVDGNEYVDALNGFGSNFFGYRHPKITQAVVDQLWRGAEIGPQSPIVGHLAKTICNFTGLERAAFCNTGSEAVMGAMRMARTVTGRGLIAIFNGAYHGIFDEVLVRGTKNLRSVPAAPGILPSSVENVLVLDYGTDEALNILRERASELAAVMIEPIQSRRPDLRPREFLHAVRQITEESGSAFIFDEVVTGFRLGPGGAQQYYNIQADIATYGKIIGGGMPIGVMAGKARFMDALDGGAWSYGDDSVPEASVTYFAGTFVRHPAAIAACQAAMEILHDGGQAIYSRLTDQTTRLGSTLNNYFEQVGAPLKVEWFSSWFRITPTKHVPYGELLFYLMRQKGVHIYDGFPCFLTMAHTDPDVDFMISACQESLRELQDIGLVPRLSQIAYSTQKNHEAPTSPLESPLSQRFSLTEAQTEIWLASQMSDMASCAYNEPFMLSLHGPLNLEALQNAIQETLYRHDALHVRFDHHEPFQRQTTPEPISLPFLDLSLSDAIIQQTKLTDIFCQSGSMAFNLSDGPLVRVQIVRLHAEDHRVLFAGHHIICDGWSWNIILKEIGFLYSAMVQRRSYELSSAASFRNYVENEIQSQSSDKAEQAYAYWMNEFKELPAPLALPIDRARPGVKTYNGATVIHIFNSTFYRAVKEAAMRQKASLFSMTFAAFNILLARLCNQSDMVASVPTAGQLIAGIETLVGHCVNLLPVRSRVDPAMSFQEFLVATTKKILEAYDHQDCTLGGIVKRLQFPRDPSRLPLVEVNFNLDRDGAEMKFQGLRATAEQTPKQAVNFDLFFNLNEVDGQLRVDLDYNSDLFDETTIQRWVLSYARILDGIVETPEQPIGQLPLLSEVERRQLLVEWNKTDQLRDPNQNVLQLLEEQVVERPAAVAVVCGKKQVTYRELNHQANQLAHYLKKKGVGSAGRVGLSVDRSCEMIVGLLGILKAGGAYVPLDPTYPHERLAFILGDAELKVLVTQASLKAQLHELTVQVVCLDTDWEQIIQESQDNFHLAPTADSLAYVMYTSGSTGKPKGVEISHGAFVNLLQAMCCEVKLTTEDRWLAVTTIAFDIAGLEIFGPLIVGGQTHLVSWDEALDGRKLRERLHESNATVMQATPATWRMLVDADWEGTEGLTILCGGAELSRGLAELLLPRGKAVWNLYGPTETTIWSAAHRVEAVTSIIPIGQSIANTQLYVLDEFLEVLPIGVPGELYIGGKGLARGYRGRPDLTEERFIRNPFKDSEGVRLYRTGDKARLLPDGTMEFLGRVDHQVKVRGFRIELGEIEVVLGQHSAVKECVVVGQKDADGELSQLVAYVVTTGDEAVGSRGQDFRRFLVNTLPEYMIPTEFVALDEFPLTPNGKIDRNALPRVDQIPCSKVEVRAAQTSTEAKLVDIWDDILEDKQIGIDENFFELGGHSLMAAKMANRVREIFMIDLALMTVFEYPTIEELAKFIDQKKLNECDEQELRDLLEELEST